MTTPQTFDPSQPIAASVDVGNGFTKFTLSMIGADLTCAAGKFPSFATQQKGSIEHTNSSSLKSLDVLPVEAGGLIFRVGPDSLLAADGKARRAPTEAFYTSNEYLALYRGALAYMDLPPGVDTIDMMGCGLPMDMFADPDIRQHVASAFAGTHVIPTRDGLSTRTIHVERVSLHQQLLGSLITLSTEHDEMEAVMQGTNLVVDVGYGTLLWLTTTGLKPQPSRSGEVRGGVSDILKSFLNAYDHKVASNPHILQRLDEAVYNAKGTVLINGEEVEIAKFAGAMDDRVNSNLRDLQDSVGQLASIDNIYLVGGGAGLYATAFKALCRGRNVRMTSMSPQLSNLTGIQILAERALKQATKDARAANKGAR